MHKKTILIFLLLLLFGSGCSQKNTNGENIAVQVAHVSAEKKGQLLDKASGTISHKMEEVLQQCIKEGVPVEERNKRVREVYDQGNTAIKQMQLSDYKVPFSANWPYK